MTGTETANVISTKVKAITAELESFRATILNMLERNSPFSGIADLAAQASRLEAELTAYNVTISLLERTFAEVANDR